STQTRHVKMPIMRPSLIGAVRLMPSAGHGLPIKRRSNVGGTTTTSSTRTAAPIAFRPRIANYPLAAPQLSECACTLRLGRRDVSWLASINGSGRGVPANRQARDAYGGQDRRLSLAR